VLGGKGCWGPLRHDDIWLELDQLGREGGEALEPPFRPAVFQDEVLAFDIAERAQLLQESLPKGVLSWGRTKQHPDPVHVRWRLRRGCERRHAEASESAGDEPDDGAPHSGLLTSIPCRSCPQSTHGSCLLQTPNAQAHLLPEAEAQRRL